MKTILFLASMLAASPAFAFYPGSPLNTATIQAARKQQVAASDASACYNIGNSDARSYCMARAHQNASLCYSIQSADMRAQCLAEVRR